MKDEIYPQWYELRDALELGDFPGASALLKGSPGLINARNRIGETVLHFLAVENNRPAVEWLGERGAEMNTDNKFGTPVLFEIALLGYRDLIPWLIEHGADPDRRDRQDRRIDEYLSEFDQPEMAEFMRDFIRD